MAKTEARPRTEGERRACIVLEDVVTRMACDLTYELMNLPEMRGSGLLKSYCKDALEAHDRRQRQLRRLTGDYYAEYSEHVCNIVDNAAEDFQRLREEMYLAQLQRVKYEHIARSTLLATIGGLLDIAGRIHRILNGRGGGWPEAREMLRRIEEALPAELLNDELPDTAKPRALFEKMFRRMADLTTEEFNKQEQE